jgi:two-component system, OmpR family, phosphate regulon sensor histidine kinase PhoR
VLLSRETFAEYAGILAGGVAGVAAGYAILQAYEPPWNAAALPACALPPVAAALAVIAYRGRRIRREVANAARALQGEGSDIRSIASAFGMEAILEQARQRLGVVEEARRAWAEEQRELNLQVRVLDNQRRHLEAILNALGDAVLVTDEFHELVIANDAAAHLLDFDLENSLHKPVGEILDDPTLTKLIRDTQEARETHVRRSVEHRLRVDGDSRFFQVTLGAVRGSRSGPAHRNHTAPQASASPEEATPPSAPGRYPNTERRRRGGVVMILRDITSDKEVAEMKSDFVSRVSHELRTPLSSIKAYVEMLIDGEAHSEESRNEFYGIIQSEADRLSRLIDNILSISRIESGVVKVNREDLSLTSLIKEAMNVVQPQVAAKSIQMHWEDPPLFFQVNADRDMIFQVMINLLSNAVKYTPAGGEIRVFVVVDEHAGTVEVSVRDTGAGIPEDALPHVFDKFYRVQSHGKLAKGTGLGLALVKHVVESVHRGKVGVTSKVDEGSTFTITLPRVKR